MKKRVLTVEELYKFCLTQNFTSFKSSEAGEELVVRMNGLFSKEDIPTNKHAEGLIPFVSRAFHDHVNLNKSNIDTDVFEDNLPSTHLRPILANIVTNEDGTKDFGSHDFYVEEDENSEQTMVYEEQPVGVIDGSLTTTEYDEEAGVNRAVVHGFMYEGYCQDAIDILERRGESSVSVELSVRAMSFDAKQKVLNIEDFYVSGLTLLGATIAPGMQNSNIKLEDFAFKKSFNYDKKLIETLEKLNETLSNFNINADNAKVLEKGGKDELTKFEELLAKYNKTLEEVTFEYENLSDEELEIAFETAFADTTEDTEDNTVGETTEDATVADDNQSVAVDATDDGQTSDGDEKFSKTFELSHDDVRCGLYGLLASYEEADNTYYYIESVYDDHFVYSDWCSNKIFGQKYTKDGDNLAFAEERYELFKELLTASEKAELETMRAKCKKYENYEEIADKLAKYEAEPEKLKILNSKDYAQIASTKEFIEFKKRENYFELSVDEVRKKADEMLLSYAKKNTIDFSATQPENTAHAVAFAGRETTNFLDRLLNK